MCGDTVRNHPISNLVNLALEALSDSGTTFSEQMLLYALVRGINAKNAIEIGTRRGHSTIWIASAIRDNGGEFLVCIDPFGGPGAGGGNDKEYTVQKLAQLELDNVLIVEELSSQALGRFPDSSFDFIYIDGDHSYDGVKNDLTHSLRILKPGGIVVLHDVSHISSVKECVDELLTRPLFLTSSMGMAVYQKEIESVSGEVDLGDWHRMDWDQSYNLVDWIWIKPTQN